MNTKTNCKGSGQAPDETTTKVAREMGRQAAVAKYGEELARKYGMLEGDGLHGRKGCGACGRTYFPKKDGTLPKHPGV